jgi:hypothetical protein
MGTAHGLCVLNAAEVGVGFEDLGGDACETKLIQCIDTRKPDAGDERIEGMILL